MCLKEKDMGYQESFIPINHLAESAGIKKAIEDYEDHPDIPEYCHYYCTARKRSTGSLFACIGGQRCRVHIIAGIDLDDCIPHNAKYADYYEDLDEALVEEAARERPDLVDLAYQGVAEAFERTAKQSQERKRVLRAEAIELWPEVARVFKVFGPMPLRLFERLPLFKGHTMSNVLADLSWQGLVTSDGRFFIDNLRLTDKAMGQLGMEEHPKPLDIEDEILKLLSVCGPTGTSDLSLMTGISAERVRMRLRKLIEEGRVASEGRGRSRRYRLANATSEAVERSSANSLGLTGAAND